jgi:hypothetical protein
MLFVVCWAMGLSILLAVKISAGKLGGSDHQTHLPEQLNVLCTFF